MKKITPYLLILFIGLISFTWFRNSDFIMGVDTVFPVNLNFSEAYFSVWSKVAFGDADFVKLPVLFPYAYFFKLLSLTGVLLDPRLLERLLIYFLFVFSGISVFRLSKESYPRLGNLAHIVSSVFYMFNFYVMFLLTALPIYLLFSYCFFPLVLSVFVRAVRGYSIRNAIITGILMFLVLTPSYATPPYLLLHLLILFLYGLFVLLNNPKRWKNVTFVFLTVAIVFSLLSLFWILPLLLSPKPPISNFLLQGSELFSTYKLNAAKVSDSLRLQGYFGFDSDFRGDKYYPWFSYYKKPFFILLSFVFVFLAFFGFLFLDKKDKGGLSYIFYSFVALLFVFLISFPYLPFNSILFRVLRPTGFFELFRTAYQRFAPFLMVSLALMSGFSFGNITGQLKNRMHLRLAVVGLFILVGIYNFPLITGIIFDQSGIMSSKRVTIPKYYYEVISWFDKKRDEDIRVLQLPFNKLGLVAFRWDKGRDGLDGFSPLSYLANLKLLFKDSSANNGKVIQSVIDDPSLDFSILSKTFGINYVIFDRSSNWDQIKGNSWWVGQDPDKLKARIDNDKCLLLEKDFDSAYIYKVKDSCIGDKFSIRSPQNRTRLIDKGDSYSDVFKAIPNFSDYHVETIVYKKNLKLENFNSKIIQVKKLPYVSSKDLQWNNDLSWPESRTSPESLLYPLVIARERFNLSRVKENRPRYTDLLIWLSAKRIEDLSKWDLGVRKKREVSTDLIGMMDTLSEQFTGVSIEKRDGNYYDLLKRAVIYLSKGLDYLEPKSGVRENVEYTVAELIKLIVTHENMCMDLCYSATSPDADNYTSYTSSDLAKEYPKAEMFINQKSLGTVGAFNTHNVNLVKGNNIISFKFEEMKNLLVDSEPKDKSNFPSPFGSLKFETLFKRSQVGTFSDYQYREISGWEPLTDYEVSFVYKVEGGELSALVFEEKIVNGTGNGLPNKFITKNVTKIATKEYVNTSGNWNTAKFMIKSGSEPSLRAFILFGTSFEDDIVSNVELKDIKITKKVYPTIFFGKNLVADVKKSVSVKKVFGNYLYELSLGDIPEGYVDLVFNERFDLGWVLLSSKSDGSKNVFSLILDKMKKMGSLILFNQYPEEQFINMKATHFVADGYSNGWEVNSSELSGKKVYVMYYPQVTMFLGAFGSLAFAIAIALVYCWLTNVNKRSNA